MRELILATIAKHGITMHHLAKVSGVSQSALSRFKDGKGLSLRALEKVCTALGLRLVADLKLPRVLLVPMTKRGRPVC